MSEESSWQAQRGRSDGRSRTSGRLRRGSDPKQVNGSSRSGLGAGRGSLALLPDTTAVHIDMLAFNGLSRPRTHTHEVLIMLCWYGWHGPLTHLAVLASLMRRAQVLDGKLAAAAAECQRISAALNTRWPALMDAEKPRDPQARPAHAERLSGEVLWQTIRHGIVLETSNPALDLAACTCTRRDHDGLSKGSSIRLSGTGTGTGSFTHAGSPQHSQHESATRLSMGTCAAGSSLGSRGSIGRVQHRGRGARRSRVRS